MQPDQPQPPQPGSVVNPGTPTPPVSPPLPTAPVTDLEPDPAGPDDPRPQLEVSQPPTQSAEPIDGDRPILSWQASEYVHHDKNFLWYLVFFVAIAGLIAVAAVTHQWLTIGVFAIMAVALMIYANKQPRVLTYSLGDLGITIETKFYAYTNFRSFGVIQDVAWHLIDLDPLKRFMPRLNILFEDNKRDQIIDLLTQHLPRHDRQPDLIERAARYLHF